MPKSNELSPAQREHLLAVLKSRFDVHMHRHPSMTWAAVQGRIASSRTALSALSEMEKTGGEPDVVVLGKTRGDVVFIDCCAQSPKGRRSVCYDGAALAARKEHKPANSAAEMAARWGAELLTEDEYRVLQTLGEFDTATSSWVQTPTQIRQLGGALFCDRRYNTVFVYHNGAESYYAARGFRCAVRV